MDVFISYSSMDKEWARGELLSRIEGAGLKAFIDFRDFTRGAPSIKEMERGVKECRKTLLVLTPTYIESEWCDLEVVMAATLSPSNRSLRVIPLLRARCEKPLYVAALTHVDFTEDADRELAWRQLLTALGAPPVMPEAPQPSREEWFLAHPYAMAPNFTGRLAERAMLTQWLNADDKHPLFVLRALGGFGKSALTWHWLLHDVDPRQRPQVVWWSFYEQDAGFESLLSQTLRYLFIDTADLSPREQVEALLKALRRGKTLLILDGFERSLRAFASLDAAYRSYDTANTERSERDCVSPLAESFLRQLASVPGKGRVLITTRFRPAAVEPRGGGLLEGCRDEELAQLQPADALEFFRAQGIRGGRAEIAIACEPYGYHPLSLRLLAGLIVNDFRQPGDIAAAPRFDVTDDLVQRQHHILQQAYESLDAEQQNLLSRIACFRSPVGYEALQAVALTEATYKFDDDLRDLLGRGLLHRDLGANRFDLHPIVRRYAYDCLTASDRTVAHARLRDYFAAIPAPTELRTLDDLAPVIELYHHTVRAGRYEDAWALFRSRLNQITFHHFAAFQLSIELLLALFPDGENRAPRLRRQIARGSAFNSLARAYGVVGQPRRAVPLYEEAIQIAETAGSDRDIAVGLGNLGIQQASIGALRAADANHRRRIEVAKRIGNVFSEAIGHRELGRVMVFRGMWTESKRVFGEGFELARKLRSDHLAGRIHAYSAQRALLSGAHQLALTEARRARELAELPVRLVGRVPRDVVRAALLLGAALRATGAIEDSEGHLLAALEGCRRMSLVDCEADSLIELARLRVTTGEVAEARRLAEEALLITERSGYVLQGADAHLVLAELARARNDKKAFREHAQEALRLATCDGPPDFTYKVAYDKATEFLRET